MEVFFHGIKISYQFREICGIDVSFDYEKLFIFIKIQIGIENY